MKKAVLTALSALPLLCHLPYLFTAWSNSRLDSWDWIFFILTIPAAWYAADKERSGNTDYSALAGVIPMLILTILTPFHQVNALGIASAMLVIFCTVWLIWSWQIACRMLPAAVILLLGTPSSSYFLSLSLGSPVWTAWGVKFLLAGICFFWIWCNKKFDLRMNRGTVIFLAALSGSALLLWHSREIYFEGKSFIPSFTPHAGEFWGRSITPDENTRRFFAAGKVEQFRYTGENSDIFVLAVQCGGNIHEIHPASHCLRTGQWMVYSEKIIFLTNDFAVTEIDAEKGESRFLVWVWYSGKDFSTPGFLGFRRHFTPGETYHTYQISVPVVDDDVEKSRKILKKFIRSLNGEMPK